MSPYPRFPGDESEDQRSEAAYFDSQDKSDYGVNNRERLLYARHCAKVDDLIPSS